MPRDSYYRWLYLRALMSHQELSERLARYDVFTDVEFNPKKQVNCQAATTYISFAKSGILEEAMRDFVTKSPLAVR